MTFSSLTLFEVLDDLASRFIINVPEEELQSVERICFQIEQAHWFYEDFVRVENPKLPSFTLKSFCAQYFLNCPLLSEWAESHEQAFADFTKYKFGVPVCGVIMFNQKMDKVLLVRGWNSKTWAFPRGKINKSESTLHCAVREVMEETGFDVTSHLVSNKKLPKRLIPMDLEYDEEVIYIEKKIREQKLRMYFAINVPEDTQFQTRTRKEISGISWHNLMDLEKRKNFYNVSPFVQGIKAFVLSRKKSTPFTSFGNQSLTPTPKPKFLFDSLLNFKFDKNLLLKCF